MTTPLLSVQMTVDQAESVSRALALYARLGMGQLEEIDYMVKLGTIKPFSQKANSATKLTVEKQDAVTKLTDEIKLALGYSLSSSLGIHSPDVCLDAKRSWEAHKVIDKEIAYFKDANPPVKGVTYDGVPVRLTSEYLPEARIVFTPAVPSSHEVSNTAPELKVS